MTARDTMTSAGADALVKRIWIYWQERGHSVDLRTKSIVERKGNVAVCIRSDMVNGWPRKMRI